MNALKILQKSAGVKPDGVFGPATFKAAAAYLHLSDNRAVHFFAQCAHESANFSQFEENLNYSADALRNVFAKYFPNDELANDYARNPQRIANRVYASRMGNGPEESGDGYKFRGRGAIQLTGRANYQDFFETILMPHLMATPDVVATEFAFDSAIYFFEKNNLWQICDRGTSMDEVTALTRRINGGYNGLGHRQQLTELYASYLK
jgi:putative chitinase